MKKKFFYITSGFMGLLALAVVIGFMVARGHKPQMPPEVAAMVNGEPVFRAHLSDIIAFSKTDEPFLPETKKTQLLGLVLKSLIDEELAVQGAKKAGIVLNEAKVEALMAYYLDSRNEAASKSLSPYELANFREIIQKRALIDDFISSLANSDSGFSNHWPTFWQGWQKANFKKKYLVRVLVIPGRSMEAVDIFEAGKGKLSLDQLEAKFQERGFLVMLSQAFWLNEENLKIDDLNLEQIAGLKNNGKIPAGSCSKLINLATNKAAYEFLQFQDKPRLYPQLALAFLAFEAEKRDAVFKKWLLKERKAAIISLNPELGLDFDSI